MRIKLPNDRAQIEKAQEALMAEVDRCGFPEVHRFAIRLAFEEAVANGFAHGSDAGEPLQVQFDVTEQRLEMSVEDNGPGFDPSSVPDPTDEANIAKPTGRGLLLIRAYMTEVRFNEKGNKITMIFRPGA